ncbi:MAG TPA: 6-pyruvoyl tetrahydropterin synthase family protein [Pirellulales bacterium]|jgi:6-pyruvoyltetrahydropterin/6-carboxytetrahydropterin synthase|nr:6-pyruvoyl tetrahydropterin synthase family protein [Pirellulales bacterium]
MPASYHVRIAKDYLVFSAAHFITFAGNICERLHGHNYRVGAEWFGALDENHYVVDFIALRDALRAIVDELDHYVLLATEHPTIRVRADETCVEATFAERRWLFPRGDCKLLPVANTTAELLARYIAERLLADMAAAKGVRPGRLRIEVDECFGQSAVCEIVE